MLCGNKKIMKITYKCQNIKVQGVYKDFFAKLESLYYKHITIVNDDSSIISKWHLSLIDDARVIFYNCNFFIIQATGLIKEGCRVQRLKVLYGCKISLENVLRERISVTNLNHYKIHYYLCAGIMCLSGERIRS